MLPFDALVVVDMQPKFYTRGLGIYEKNRQLAYKINKDIKAFKEEGKPVFILEYEDYGHTDNKLDTEGCIILQKIWDGGGFLINNHIYENNYDAIKRVLVTGINACACVRHTAWELHECGFIVSIGKIGCNCHFQDKESQLRCRLRANTFSHIADREFFSKRQAKRYIRQQLAIS